MREQTRAYQQMRLYYNTTRQSLSERINRYRQCMAVLDRPDATAADIGRLRTGGREIAPGVTLRAVEVASADFVPDTPLYYIANTREWGVRIGGQLITGQIGEITQMGKKHIACRRGTHDRKLCPMWHHGEPRAWHPSQFLYTESPPAPGNRIMRHVGSRSTLATDIDRLPPGEAAVRRRQLAHDLLVSLALKIDDI